MKCKTCRQEYTPACDYNQGRCPHHKPMIDIQPRDTSRGHFYVSLVKSFVRVGAGAAFIMAWISPDLTTQFVATGGLLLIIAEALGVLEELV